VTAGSESTRTPAQIGPYRIRSVLGKGGMGVIYLGEHRDSSSRAAIKTALLPQEGPLKSLRREIHALARIQHPGIIRLLDHGIEHGLPWYAMELLEGRTLADRFKSSWVSIPCGAPAGVEIATTRLKHDQPPAGGEEPSAPPESALLTTAPDLSAQPALAASFRQGAEPPERHRLAGGGKLLALLRILRELCDTLACLHGEGIVHRDLKPDNILLDENDAPVLLDFGLAWHSPGALGREILDVAGVAGTVSYIAPEQIRGQIVDPRADLYAVGCLLYEAVTGAPPFTGSSIHAIIHQHLSAIPRPPSTIVDGVDQALDEVILRLLSKRPRDRPGHADDIARTLEALGAAPLRNHQKRPVRAYVYRPKLVGRRAAIEELTRGLDLAQGGIGSVTLLRGESGIGKTYLAMALARAAQERGVCVITGSAIPVAAGVEEPTSTGSSAFPMNPTDARLHLFRAFFQAVSDRCRAHGEAVTDALLGEHPGVIAACSPEFDELSGKGAFPHPPELPAKAAHERLLLALADMLFAFAKQTPMLLVLDDLQWADDLSLDLLSLLSAEPRIAEASLLIVGTYRAEETTPALLSLGARPGVGRVDLGRLDEASVGAIIGDMLALEDPPAPFVSFLARQSDGNPFFVAEYIRTAVTEGLLQRNIAGQWEIAAANDDASAYERLPLPGSLRDLITHHLHGLSPGARELARCASVIGREVLAELLSEVARLDETRTLDAQSELLVRQILDEPEPGRLRFLHDKLREIAYAEIPAATRQVLHLRAALAIERRNASEPEFPRFYPSLAHHFTRAGDTEKSIEYLDKAATAAIASFANREAVGFLHDLSLLRQQTLLGADAPKALRELTSIVDVVRKGSVRPDDQLKLSRWERQLANAYHSLGNIPAAVRHASCALAWTGHSPPESALGWGLRLLREIPIQAAHRLVPGASQAGNARAHGARREATHALQRLAESAFYDSAPLAAASAILWGLNEAESARASLDISRSYADIGLLCAQFRLPGVARHYLALSRAAAEKGADESARAYSRWAEMMGLVFDARWEEARAAYAATEPLVARLGDRQELEMTWIGMNMLCRSTGEFEASLENSERLIQSARERGNLQHLGWGVHHAVGALTKLGRFSEAEELIARFQRDFASCTDMAATANYVIGSALAYFHAGRLDEAAGAAERASSMLNWQMNVSTLFSVSTAATTIHLARWEGARSDRPDDAVRAEQAARQALRTIFECALRLKVCSVQYHLFRGRTHRIAGAVRRARRSFARALDLARRLEMRYMEASAHLELARLEPESAAKRRVHLSRAEALFEEMKCPADVAACRSLGNVSA
jgi:serine/threonine protein kinase/tetratricopeptide (TPR) repeat protein